MINDLIHIMRNLESAFFFIIPVLLVLAVFSKNIFKHNKAFYFLLTAGIIILGIRIILVFTVNKLVGRYYLPVVIIWTCFAPAGVYFLAKLVQYSAKKLKLKTNFEIIIKIVMILILIGSAVKAFKITKKDFLNKFAVCLKPFDSEDTILLTLTGTGKRINDRLSGKIKIQGPAHAKRSFYYWLDFFDKFEKSTLKYKNIFIAARQRKKLKYEGDSFENIFRSYYLTFPFDLVKKCDYRKDTYLLYRFNNKITDILPPRLNMPKTIYLLPDAQGYKLKIVVLPVRILLIEPDARLFYKNSALLKTTLEKFRIKAEIVSLYDFAAPELRFGYWNILKKINVIKDGIKRHPKLFSSPFDIVLINCGYRDVYSAGKRWRINTEAKKMKQQLNTFIRNIQEMFPNASIGVAMPIAPAPAATYYDIAGRKKQGHRALCKSLYNCLGNRENEKIYIVSLFHNIDPEKDYQLTTKKIRAKGIKYWYPMALSKTGRQKSANSLAAWILYVMKSSAGFSLKPAQKDSN